MKKAYVVDLRDPERMVRIQQQVDRMARDKEREDLRAKKGVTPMTETDYIRATDLARIRLVKNAMFDINREDINQLIRDEERFAILSILTTWEDRIGNVLEVVGEPA